jgi:hypothetical protein
MRPIRETTLKIPLTALGVGAAAMLLAHLWLLRLDELMAVLGIPVSLAGVVTTTGGGFETVRRLVRRRGRSPSQDVDGPADGILVGLILLTVIVVLFFSAWAL